jgi:uncharacterized membrane protein YraQ (UPF0718 family)
MQYINKNKLKISLKKSKKALFEMLPIFLGTILLVSLLNALIPKDFYINLFQKGNIFINSLIGSLVGGISVGTPMVSYIIGGELLDKNISIAAISAFLVSWVTIGVLQIPLEISFFGKKFTFYRNIFSFIFSIIIGIIIFLILNIL